MINDIEYIRKKLTYDELLLQLAEEASEVSVAALKMVRAKGINKGKSDIGTAKENLVEEIADVMVCIKALGIDKQYEDNIAIISGFKEKRWSDRLRQEGEKCIKTKDGR